MFHKWLDRKDERRAQRGEEEKKPIHFALDPQLAFPGTSQSATFLEFSDLAEQAVLNPTFFSELTEDDLSFEKKDGWINFRSDISTDIDKNNIVWAKIAESGSLDKVMVVFHHWNASSRNRQIASFFSWCGITVVEIAMPYHFERSRPGSTHADYMLSPNLGRTIQSVRQAVMDGRKLIRWLKSEGYGEISVLGMSLGSWVAGLIAAHDSTVAKASLFLSAGSLADMVWTGRATQLIRESLEPVIDQDDLNKAWGPVNLENYVHRLARPDLDLQVVLAKRDRVVLPEISERFIALLEAAGAKPDILRLNCGHYSLAIPPYGVLAGLRLKSLLGRR